MLIKDTLKEESVVKTVKKVESVNETPETEVTKVLEVEEEKVDEDILEVEESENIVKTTYSRKKNYKVDVE